LSDTHWPAAFEEILARHLPLAEGDVPRDAALSDLGLDSLGTVSLVMELEDSLDISIPDELLVAETFQTAATLWAATSDLLTRA
jgi:acyl carrier protein